MSTSRTPVSNTSNKSDTAGAVASGMVVEVAQASPAMLDQAVRRCYLLNQLGNQPPSQCRRWGGCQTGSARVSSANRTYGP